mmetsp:Transcript_57759/g.137486  ORF Transcript_57759/g.137486 Transcript_57759/m.137486 type:complete len:655 (+) Transcript_57759:113-2077(+)
MSAVLPATDPYKRGYDCRDAVAPRATYPFQSFDVRVSDKPVWNEQTLGDLGSVSLREILGASLVTFGEHIGPPLDVHTPIPPKAVYVKYQQADPVSGGFIPIVVPAQLCLDVFTDGSFGDVAPEFEYPSRSEELPPEEQSDRRKLRSSIKGDPILMRAKPVRPPEPYICAALQEGQALEVAAHAGLQKRRPQSHRSGRIFTGEASAERPGSSGGDAWASEQAYGRGHADMEAWTPRQHDISSGAEDGQQLDAGSQSDETDRSCAGGERGPASVRLVEHKSTVSSFIKAGGRDRYCRPRLREIDSILDRAVVDESRNGSVRSASVAGFSPAQGASRLTAQLATQMHRIPQFHDKKATSAPRRREEQPEDAAAHPQSSVQFNHAVSGSEGIEGPSQEASATGSKESAASSVLAVPPEIPQDDDNGGVASPGSQQRSWRKQDRRIPSNSSGRGTPRKLRLIDPHLPVTGFLPTQRLHANWPYGAKREIARHFYGMTPEEVAAEEELERLAEEGGAKPALVRQATTSRSARSNEELSLAEDEALMGTAGDADEMGRRPKQVARRLEPSCWQHGPQGNHVTHRLEVRIRNIDRPERFVVAKSTPRLRGPREALSRPMDFPTSELAEAASRFHVEPSKIRRKCIAVYRDDVPPRSVSCVR